MAEGSVADTILDINDYTPCETIGIGQCGTTVRVFEDRRTLQRFAVKCYPLAQGLDNSDVTEQFSHEVDALVSLSH